MGVEDSSMAYGEQALRWLAAERVEETPAVGALVREHSGVLYRVAYSVVRNAAEAEDVVQDVFLRVLQKPAALEGVLEVRAWLVRVAWNLALDHRRRWKAARTEQMEADFCAALAGRELPADVALEEQRRMARVLEAIDRLPKLERQALLLTAVEELGTREIAEVMSRSESSVRSLVFRARTRLRERLGEESGR